MSGDIFRITKDLVRAKDLFEMANERLTTIIPILPKDKYFKLIEEYYEVIVQLITSIMYADGYKTLGHVGLINYLETNYIEFDNSMIKIIDSMRKIRHGSIYYGKKVGEEFVINNIDIVKQVIIILNTIIKHKIKEIDK